ncbi:glucose 1-dehydrogenase [Nocardioides sp. SR21]|uniref:glucose 1-dehydrogenase n=1 Tax=Nocardioides sp. SR21 TaxID=2919501 RepID=UPI001FA987FB|nr:glucose 1-dehydrogenase [Nocardioides sp. SR21]
MSLLTNKVGFVTGSGSGIGRESARVMAREGAAVVVSDINVEGGKETVEMIRGEGGEAFFIAADVSRESEIHGLIEGTLGQYGRLDFAYNNAGIAGPTKGVADYPLDEFDKVVAVNLRGVFLAMQAELAHMLPLGRGAILNTSSTFGLVGYPGCAAYVATKHAVAGLTRAAAIENSAAGIRVNAVCPGAIATPMVDEMADEISPGARQPIFDALGAAAPMGRMGRPQEIGEAAAWLVSDAASFVTGLTMTVDGGWTAQ